MSELDPTLAALSALSQETRLRAFRELMAAGTEGMPAGLISDRLDVAPNSLSSHLSILTAAGLVSVRRDGRRMIYRAEIDAVNGLLATLVETCCHGHPEVCGALGALAVTRC